MITVITTFQLPGRSREEARGIFLSTAPNIRAWPALRKCYVLSQDGSTAGEST
jgi:hypothetical protein